MMIGQFIFLLHLIIALYGCHPRNVIVYDEQTVPSIYFQLGTDYYAQEFPNLDNVGTLPDSVYVFEQLRDMLSNPLIPSVTIIPFRDSTEDVRLVQRRVEKVKEAFGDIGIDSIQITVMTDHGRANPVSEQRINALSSESEQEVARSLNSCVALLIQPAPR